MTVSDKKGNIEKSKDRIADIFQNKTILITGVTGFLGKVLLEKLLRNSPGINKIYVIIRPKYGLTSKERLDNIFKSSLFNQLKSSNSFQAIQSKVCTIQGDVSLINLGLSSSDRLRLLTDVDIIYHSAAHLRLDESLKTSVLMNVRGTRCMLQLAKEMTHLQLFCHVSTAYCQVQERIIYEKAYKPPADPVKIIQICEGLDEAILSAVTHKILGSYPNTYTFTKALAEELINQVSETMPIILLRPSLVIPALNEPIPGWTDTINGSIGFQIAAGKGILRTLYADVTCYPDLIPVDIAVNAFLCATFDFLQSSSDRKKRTIYNLTTSDRHKVSWFDIISLGREVIFKEMPLNWVVWYPGGTIKSNKIIHDICFMIQHVIPAAIVDTILFCLNKPGILLPIYRRIQKGFDILGFFNGKQWDFDNANSQAAVASLSCYEKQQYGFDDVQFDYREYFRDCTLCARRYILNEPDETLPRARQHMRMMFYVDKIYMSLVSFIFFNFLFGYLEKNSFLV